jgi:hypothetical protein
MATNNYNQSQQQSGQFQSNTQQRQRIETQRQRQEELLGAYNRNFQMQQAAVPQGQASIRAQAARQLASTAAGVPVGSGAGLAAGAMSGYNAEMASAIYGSKAAQELGQAGVDAADAAYEASLPDNYARNYGEAMQEKQQAFLAKIDEIAANTPGWLGIGIDEEAVVAKLQELAALEQDPDVQAWMYEQITKWNNAN